MADNDDDLTPPAPPLPDEGENQRQVDAAGQSESGALVELTAVATETGAEGLGVIGWAAGQAADVAGEAAGVVADAAGSVVGSAAEGLSGCSCSVVVMLAVCLSAGSVAAAFLIR
jgi:hypothetical protein